jgi:ABC-type lipoprotein release transport system permease subunit
VTPAAYLVRPQVTTVEGREPREPFELMVGRLAATRMGLDEEDLAMGATIHLERRDWRICGRFAAPDTVLEAEMWAQLEDLMLATKREDVSCVALRIESPDGIPEVALFAAKRLDLEVVAVPERALMASLERGLLPITALARWMALLVLAGGGFACANTMFAAVLARTRELATLRALGYSPAAVAVALVEESALVAFLGGAIGLFLALAIGNVSIRFPMGAFTLELDVLRRGLGLGAALASGLLGGLVPAWRAVRMPLVDALGGKA